MWCFIGLVVYFGGERDGCRDDRSRWRDSGTIARPVELFRAHVIVVSAVVADATGGVAGSAETGERLAAVVAVRPHLIFEGTAA